MSTIHVACAADRRYAGHSAAMLHSVLSQRGAYDVRVHYLHGPRFPSDSASKLEAMVASMGGAVSFYEIPDERIAGLPAMDHAEITPTMWYRIFLSELLPDTERLLYLDIDTIAVASLASLWETELADNYVGAVTNVFPPGQETIPEHLGLRSEDYFNSGVLLLNLAATRRDRCLERVLEFALEKRDRLHWPDQDALNVILGPKRLALHPRWNAMNSLRTYADRAEEVFGAEIVREAREHPSIRHFEGPGINKPWHILCERAQRDLYAEHRRATPWPRYRRTGVTPANLLRRLAMTRRSATETVST